MKIGIVGYGFVGAAVAESFACRADLVICDPSHDATFRADMMLLGRSSVFQVSTVDNIAAMGQNLDCVFVCVPTPPGIAGACDDSILTQVVADLMNWGTTDTVICKCTAPVSTYQQLRSDLVAYSPEYLRAASATSDYLSQSQVVIGANDTELAKRCIAVYNESSLVHSAKLVVPRDAAVIAKYAHNVSLAVKVAVLNEVATVAKAYDVDWEQVRLCLTGTAAGHSHTQVPGPGGPGFGGACFPKDVAAFLADVTDLQDLGDDNVHAGVVLAAFADWCQPEGLPLLTHPVGLQLPIKSK